MRFGANAVAREALAVHIALPRARCCTPSAWRGLAPAPRAQHHGIESRRLRSKAIPHRSIHKQSTNSMATAKKVARKAPVAKKASTSPADMKPIKTAFNRSSLVAHLAQVAATELKAARALMAALEATILASVHKKGLGSFTLPGLLKVNVINVPAKKKRRGIDPFTKVEREFAAKPATVKIKTRALKKLKDAAL